MFALLLSLSAAGQPPATHEARNPLYKELLDPGLTVGPNILAADRAMWDDNPVMANSSIVNLSKAGQGRFYQFPYESARNSARHSRGRQERGKNNLSSRYSRTYIKST